MGSLVRGVMSARLAATFLFVKKKMGAGGGRGRLEGEREKLAGIGRGKRMSVGMGNGGSVKTSFGALQGGCAVEC